MGAAQAPAAIEFGRFTVLPRRRELLAEGRPLELGGRAFDVLMALIEASVFGYLGSGRSRTRAQAALRQAPGCAPGRPALLKRKFMLRRSKHTQSCHT